MLMRQAMLGAMVVVGGLSADDRISQTEKGSVLITPFVQDAPDIDGQILLSNDHPEQCSGAGLCLVGRRSVLRHRVCVDRKPTHFDRHQ